MHKPRLPRPIRPHGFTLVEVLVALGVMALLALISWRGLDAMLRTQAHTSRHTDAALTLQAAISQWRADLDAMASWPIHTSPAPPMNTARSLLWDGVSLRLTRGDIALPDQPAPGLRVVAWALRANGQWLRWQSPPLQSQQAWASAWEAAAQWGQTQGGSGDTTGLRPGGVQVVDMGRASNWQLHYYRGNAWVNPLSSVSQTEGEGLPPSAVPALPDGVRLLLTLPDGGPHSGLLTLDWARPDLRGVN